MRQGPTDGMRVLLCIIGVKGENLRDVEDIISGLVGSGVEMGKNNEIECLFAGRA